MRRTLPALALLLATTCSSSPASADVGIDPVATGLNFPTNLAFLPDGGILYAEKDAGRIRMLLSDGEARVVAELPVAGGAERGLLGIALHPRFPGEPWLYVYYSDATDGRNRLVRMRLSGGTAGRRETLLDLLPAVSGYHNGGDLAFGADGMLYVVTGEAHEPTRAQSPEDLGGKVLRIAPDGSIPDDDPFPGSPVFTLGHRNSFGLCVNPETGDVWETENGPDRDDEVNLLRPGGNYGWPEVLGPGGGPAYIDPAIVFPTVIVPTGCAFTAPDTMWFGDFRGDLHRVSLGGPDLDRVIEHHDVLNVGSGITDVAVAPDGRLYLATATGVLRVTGVRAAPELPPGASEEPTPTPTRGAAQAPPPTESPAAGQSDDGDVAGAALGFLVFGALVAALVWTRRRATTPPGG